MTYHGYRRKKRIGVRVLRFAHFFDQFVERISRIIFNDLVKFIARCSHQFAEAGALLNAHAQRHRADEHAGGPVEFFAAAVRNRRYNYIFRITRPGHVNEHGGKYYFIYGGGVRVFELVYHRAQVVRHREKRPFGRDRFRARPVVIKRAVVQRPLEFGQPEFLVFFEFIRAEIVIFELKVIIIRRICSDPAFAPRHDQSAVFEYLVINQRDRPAVGNQMVEFEVYSNITILRAVGAKIDERELIQRRIV